MSILIVIILAEIRPLLGIEEEIIMRTLWFISIAAILALSGCGESNPADTSYPADFDRGTEQAYVLSDGYFIGNWYVAETNPSCLVFRDYDCFDAYFSIGWYMGLDESKLITEEGMEDGFVLSVIYQGNDIPKLGIEKVALHNGKLIVYYTHEVVMADASFTANMHLTVLIDDCDFDSVILFENGSRITHASITEVDCD
jgi:hypothetical protein